MENRILGLHHITAIASNAKINYEFYINVLDLRMVKKTVNFHDPATYHFYYGDESGTPGTILTFLPWEGIGQRHTCAGMATGINYSVPAGSLAFLADLFKQYNVEHQDIGEMFGEEILPFTDPDGLNISLVVAKISDTRKGWVTQGVTENEANKGFHSIALTLKNIEATAELLTEVMGYRFIGQEANRYRVITDAIENASIVDLVESPELPAGVNAAGTNHHVAFRVSNEEILMDFREKIASRGLGITPKIDRDYFFSLYFREPGGVLFELATDNPGFTRDEPLAALGSNLKLPRQYEQYRSKIEATLPKLDQN